jgi:hypothetical protein
MKKFVNSLTEVSRGQEGYKNAFNATGGNELYMETFSNVWKTV